MVYRDQMVLYLMNVLTIKVNERGYVKLDLTDRIGWDDFPSFADTVVSLIGAVVLIKRRIVYMHMWDLQLNNTLIRFVFEDYPLTTSLESADPKDYATLENVRQFLIKERHKHWGEPSTNGQSR